MYFKALKHIVGIPLLLIIVVSATSGCIGKLRSHSMISVTQDSFSHSHTTSHSHDLESDYQFHHDASNHSHDSESFSAISNIAFANLTETKSSRLTCGSPCYLPFRIERPPKHHHSA
ncbi:hypothetical protein [Vibrio sp. SCSIO 43137]|uniref:hypothetical protein n=1 Tax=Vibrio sp. SCSIO 43137 TaxID=3021011 RepID=UPI0023072B0C|nr:hypothetical protein [Vibrio sp. SCSIO 43137]WCE31515.1 hypothetical protein PK654_20525 [Vibrio sp. SCSIO 43137]